MYTVYFYIESVDRYIYIERERVCVSVHIYMYNIGIMYRALIKGLQHHRLYTRRFSPCN